MKVSVRASQRFLVVAWLAGAAPPFVLLAIQTMTGRFGSRVQEAWGWLLPTIMPTLLLVIGVVTADSLRAARDKRVDRFYFRLALGLTTFYLLLVNGVLIAGSLTRTPVATILQSNLFLGPVQGLVGAGLGVFFVSRDPATASDGKDAAVARAPAEPA